MPENTLEIARSKALEVSLSIAKMSKVSEILPKIDELLETLTGEKVFEGRPMMRPPPPPTPTETILALLESHGEGITQHTICKETGIDKATVGKTIDTLMAQGMIISPVRKGWKQYTLVK